MRPKECHLNHLDWRRPGKRCKHHQYEHDFGCRRYTRHRHGLECIGLETHRRGILLLGRICKTRLSCLIHASTREPWIIRQWSCHRVWNNRHQSDMLHILSFRFDSNRFVCKGRRTHWCCPSCCPWNDRHCMRYNRHWRICRVRSNRYRRRMLCKLFDLYRLGIGRRDMPNNDLGHCRTYLNHIHCRWQHLSSLSFHPCRIQHNVVHLLHFAQIQRDIRCRFLRCGPCF